jgi:membrane-bound lytic murein transglycosylase B
MKNIFQKIFLSSIIAFSSHAYAEEECTYFTFEGWKECFIQNKLNNNPSPKALDLLNNAKINDRVIALDGKQPESTLDFKGYLLNIGFKNKVAKGKEFLKNNQPTLEIISKLYNVEPEVIVALVGMESDYGKIQGKFNIVDSIASLAYDGRRRELFENQFLAAIKIAEEDDLGYKDFKGSWAGAMGWCQFMPTSFRDFAVDHNKDGVRDIWSTKSDVFASTANYLNIHGWQLGSSKVAKYQENDDKNQFSTGLDTSICNDSSKLCKLNESTYLLFQENDGILTPTFLVGTNFNVLMKWNKSYYFSLSVLMIADQLKNA